MNYDKIFQSILAEELAQGCHADRLLWLDRGRKFSEAELAQLWQRWQSKLDSNLPPSDSQIYPELAQIPIIDESKLEFLPIEITEACVCVGYFAQGQLYCQWWGKNALVPVQMWSTTKIVPMIAFLTKIDSYCSITPPEDWQIGGYSLRQIYDRIMDYSDPQMSSNALAGMLKQFFSPAELNAWLQGITGNSALEFTGLYGELPWIGQPQLIDPRTGQVLLNYSTASHYLGTGKNYLSAYDLTRIMSLIGWHEHLPTNSRLPLSQWEYLRLLVTALAKDNARYVDRVCPHALVLSKMGFGYSNDRHRTEIAYTCYLKNRELQSICFSLRGYSAVSDPNLAACIVDACIATVVTQILDRVLTLT